MKKKLLIFSILTSAFFHVNGGGLVTNSNQSASYYRMLARGAAISGDAVYYNPAGLVFLEDGLTISLNNQMIRMKRTINNDLQTLNRNEFTGELNVPFFPGIYAAYKTGNWAFSLGFNPPAGGGSVEFKDGLPMLESPVSLIPVMLSQMELEVLTTNYYMESMMRGSSIVYGVQAGISYKINEMIGVSGGVRMMFANNSYRGFVRNITINPNLEIYGLPLTGEMLNSSELDAVGDALQYLYNTHSWEHWRELAVCFKSVAESISDQSLDVKQSGNGLAPILGFHFNNNGLNLAAKYEFRTKITIVNETKQNAMNFYPNKQKLRSDVPALLSLAGSYDIVPALTISFTYLHHFEPQAEIESWDATEKVIIKRQDLIDSGTNEYMAGLECKIGKFIIISAGCQYSDVSVSSAWQNDITHNLDNLTIGLGLAFNFGERLTLNIGGLSTKYTPVTIDSVATIPNTPVSVPYKQTYDRTNKAFAIGIDYRF